MPSRLPTPDAAALAPVVDQLGRPGWGDALLAWLAPTLQARHVTAFRFDAGAQARVVLTASAGGSPIALQSARVYAGSGLYRHDRLQQLLATPASAASPAANTSASTTTGADDAPAIVRLQRHDIADAAYGQQLWDRFGLVDRLSALALCDGHWLAFNAYRDQASGAFGPAQTAQFAALAPLLLALLRQHLAQLKPARADAADGTVARVSPEAAAALLQRLPVKLSGREREVCALTVAGHSREGIALTLGIAASSVATLRERAYRKLQIHGAGELFALCLQQLQGDGTA